MLGPSEGPSSLPAWPSGNTSTTKLFISKRGIGKKGHISSQDHLWFLARSTNTSEIVCAVVLVLIWLWPLVVHKIPTRFIFVGSMVCIECWARYRNLKQKLFSLLEQSLVFRSAQHGALEPMFMIHKQALLWQVASLLYGYWRRLGKREW